MSYYPEPNNHGGSKLNVGLDLSNYGTKSEERNEQVLLHRILLKKLI